MSVPHIGHEANETNHPSLSALEHSASRKPISPRTSALPSLRASSPTLQRGGWGYYSVLSSSIAGEGLNPYPSTSGLLGLRRGLCALGLRVIDAERSSMGCTSEL